MLSLKVITAQTKQNGSLPNGLQHVGIYNLNFLWPLTHCGQNVENGSWDLAKLLAVSYKSM